MLLRLKLYLIPLRRIFRSAGFSVFALRVANPAAIMKLKVNCWIENTAALLYEIFLMNLNLMSKDYQRC
jgi:hypothetical protein